MMLCYIQISLQGSSASKLFCFLHVFPHLSWMVSCYNLYSSLIHFVFLPVTVYDSVHSFPLAALSWWPPFLTNYWHLIINPCFKCSTTSWHRNEYKKVYQVHSQNQLKWLWDFCFVLFLDTMSFISQKEAAIGHHYFTFIAQLYSAVLKHTYLHNSWS